MYGYSDDKQSLRTIMIYTLFWISDRFNVWRDYEFAHIRRSVDMVFSP